MFSFWFKPSPFSKILLVKCQTRPRILIFHSTISLPLKKVPLSKFFDGVIACDLWFGPPPLNQKSWLCLCQRGSSLQRWCRIFVCALIYDFSFALERCLALVERCFNRFKVLRRHWERLQSSNMFGFVQTFLHSFTVISISLLFCAFLQKYFYRFKVLCFRLKIFASV